MASGRGSNAASIIKYFKNYDNIKISLLLSNRKSSGIYELGDAENIVAKHVPKALYADANSMLNLLQSAQIDFVILAGFLKLIPKYLVEAFPNRILNIHPSLLPKFGGKGMYGINVHQAVYESGEKETGLSIHLVNEKYDDGAILFQHKVAIEDCKNADEIAAKVLAEEHKCYPKVIEEYVLSFKE